MDNKKPAEKQSWLTLIVAQVMLTTCISVLVVTVYDSFRYRSIITVDIEAIMENKMEGIREDVEQKISQDEMVRRSQQWASQLAQEVQTISTQYNAVVFTRPAVIEGSIDMTEEIMARLE